MATAAPHDKFSSRPGERGNITGEGAALTRLVPEGAGDMSAYFEVCFSDSTHYLEVHLRGLWDLAIFECFAPCYLRAVTILASHGGITHQLVDASEFALQPPDVAERFPALIETAHSSSNLRSASVVPSLVNRIQARPSGAVINGRYFKTHADARDWLFSDEA